MNETTLESGDALVRFLHNFEQERTSENAMFVLQCLRDSVVIIPCTLRMSDEDAEQIKKSAEDGSIVQTKDEIGMKPDFLIDQNTQELVFPVFSQSEQIPPDYGANFSNLCMPFIEVCSTGQSFDDVNTISVDPFTFNFRLGKELMDVVLKLPTMIDEE